MLIVKARHAITIFLLFYAVNLSAQKRLELPQAERGWYASGGALKVFTNGWPVFEYGSSIQLKIFTAPIVSAGYRAMPYIHPQIDLSYYAQNLKKNPYMSTYKEIGAYENYEKINFGMIRLQTKMSPFKSERRVRPYLNPSILWQPYSVERRTIMHDTATGLVKENFLTKDRGSYVYFSLGFGVQVRVWKQVEVFIQHSRTLKYNEDFRTLWGGMYSFISYDAGINYHFGRRKKDVE